MLLIIGRFQLKAGEGDTFRKFANDAIEKQKQVPGCLTFLVLQDLADADHYVMMETWQDRASLTRHFDSEEYAAADAKLNELIIGEPEWEEYEV